YIFEDECYIGLRNTQQIVWCKRGEPTPKKTISSLRAHINLIGFIWWDGYIFYRFDQWLNSDSYCETVDLLLSEHLPQLNGYLYVSDGIKWHRSAQFKQWCHQYDIELCEWPGYSPDFNAIELVWNIVKQNVKMKNPKSQGELEGAVDEAIDELSLNFIQACIGKTQKIYQQFSLSQIPCNKGTNANTVLVTKYLCQTCNRTSCKFLSASKSFHIDLWSTDDLADLFLDVNSIFPFDLKTTPVDMTKATQALAKIAMITNLEFDFPDNMYEN
ncbi:unnamed protein product, partial [Rotaria sp. Silwood2]